jgi:hypothetical protein
LTEEARLDTPVKLHFYAFQAPKLLETVQKAHGISIEHAVDALTRDLPPLLFQTSQTETVTQTAHPNEIILLGEPHSTFYYRFFVGKF